MKRALLALFVAALVAVAWAWRTERIQIPDRWNPWATLSIVEQPNFLTRHKLARLSDDPAQCMQVLATTSIEYESVPDEITGDACGYANAVKISRTSATVETQFALTCRAAVSLALWEHHVLQPPRGNTTVCR